MARPEILDQCGTILLTTEKHHTQTFESNRCRIFTTPIFSPPPFFQDGALYVHIFVASDRTYLQYHGKKIDPVTRFKIQDPSTGIGYPDPTLLQWHYKQCVQARIRGYAYDMSINAQGGVVAT